MTNEELQKLLTSFEQEVGKIKQWEIDRNDRIRHAATPSSTILGGTKGGNTHKKSGHIAKLGKKWGKINANLPQSKLASSIIGKLHGSNNINKITKEQKSKGGKTSYENHCKSGWIDEYRKIGTKASTEARINRGLENKKKIINSIKSDTFTTSEIRKACEDFEYKSWKSILKESKLIEQIYKGTNQFNPSIYKKLF